MHTYIPSYINTYNRRPNIGHRFGHQSGVNDSSGQFPAAVLNVFAVASIWWLHNMKKHQHLMETKCCVKNGQPRKRHNVFPEKNACGKPVQP